MEEKAQELNEAQELKRKIKQARIGRYICSAIALFVAFFGKYLHLPSPWTFIGVLIAMMYFIAKEKTLRGE